MQAFGNESLLSMTGGYIGIFLGISLLQMPALLECLLQWFDKILRHQKLGAAHQDNGTHLPMEAPHPETLRRGLQQVRYLLIKKVIHSQ